MHQPLLPLVHPVTSLICRRHMLAVVVLSEGVQNRVGARALL